jgi:hypothetical protein
VVKEADVRCLVRRTSSPSRFWPDWQKRTGSPSYSKISLLPGAANLAELRTENGLLDHLAGMTAVRFGDVVDQRLVGQLRASPQWKQTKVSEQTKTPDTFDWRVEKELEAVRGSIKRGSLLGNETWVASIARRFGLESTLRPHGRPQVRKLPNKDS